MHRLTHSESNFQAQLNTRYQEQLAQLTQAIEVKQKERASKVEAAYNERKVLGQRASFTQLQLDIINQYLQSPNDYNSTTYDAQYKKDLADLAKEAVEIHLDYMKERKEVLRNGEFVRLNAEQRAIEERQLLTDLDQVLKDYENFKLDIENDLLAQKKQLEDQISRYQDQAYESINGAYETQTAIDSEIAGLYTAREELQIQQKLLLSSMPTVLEQCCILGDLNAFKAAIDAHIVDKSLVTHEAMAAVLADKAPNALHYACWYHQSEIINFLLTIGVPLDQPDSMTGANITTHYYPVHYIARSIENNLDSDKVINLLMLLKNKGANFRQEDVNHNPRLPTYGRTPLHTAAFAGNHVVAAWLISEVKASCSEQEANAFINAREKGIKQKNTALHNATYYGHFSVVELLLKSGAIADEKNNSGQTPLVELLCALSSENPGITEERLFERKLEGLHLFYKLGWPLSEADFQQLTQAREFKTAILPVLQNTGGRYLIDGWCKQYQAYQEILANNAGAKKPNPMAFHQVPREQVDPVSSTVKPKV